MTNPPEVLQHLLNQLHAYIEDPDTKEIRVTVEMFKNNPEFEALFWMELNVDSRCPMYEEHGPIVRACADVNNHPGGHFGTTVEQTPGVGIE